MAFPQLLQDTKLEYPRRLMNSMTCSFFSRRSFISSCSRLLKMDLFPSLSSPRISTISVDAKALPFPARSFRENRR